MGERFGTNEMNKYILSVKPSEYLKQGRTHCGMYALKGILNAYGLDDNKNPEDYHPNLIGKITGATLPWTFPRILSKYGLKAEVRFANSEEEKTDLLKSFLQKNHPIILLVGNGYDRNGHYSSFKAKFSWHWITLWGFDNLEKIFYVYDSAVSKGKYDLDIPTGNKKRKYSEVIRDWKAGMMPFGFWRYLYIPVTKV